MTFEEALEQCSSFNQDQNLSPLTSVIAYVFCSFTKDHKFLSDWRYDNQKVEDLVNGSFLRIWMQKNGLTHDFVEQLNNYTFYITPRFQLDNLLKDYRKSNKAEMLTFKQWQKKYSK